MHQMHLDLFYLPVQNGAMIFFHRLLQLLNLNALQLFHIHHEDETVEEHLNSVVATIGEKISLRRLLQLLNLNALQLFHLHGEGETVEEHLNSVVATIGEKISLNLN